MQSFSHVNTIYIRNIHKNYVLTLTSSRLEPVILRVSLSSVTVYLYSPIFASFVEKLCSKAERRTPDETKLYFNSGRINDSVNIYLLK